MVWNVSKHTNILRKLMKQGTFFLLVSNTKCKAYVLFLALKAKSKLIRITDSETLN